AGHYWISVAAAQYQTYTESAFEVEAGKGTLFSRTLLPNPTQRATPSVVLIGKKSLDGPKTQPSFSFFCHQVAGTYSFKIKLRRALLSRKRAKWVIGFVDNRNYIEYEIDDKNLKYTAHRNGREQSSSVQHRISMSSSDTYDRTVSVIATEILI